MDLLTQFDPVAFRGDLVLAGPSLAVDNSLRTAVLISLFTDRKARADDVLPAAAGGAVPVGDYPDRRGWWGDFYLFGAGPASADAVRTPAPSDRIGSRLWLLSREKQLATVLELARTYTIEALQWMLDQKVAQSVDVLTEISAPGWLGIQVTITRSHGIESHKFDYAWSAL